MQPFPYPTLDHFFRAYLHQDWDLEYENDLDALDDFAKGDGRAGELFEEINSALTMPEPELHAAVFRVADYDFGDSAHAWLERLRAHLMLHFDRSQLDPTMQHHAEVQPSAPATPTKPATDIEQWGLSEPANDDPLRGDDQPTASPAADPSEVTATDRDRQVSVHLRHGRLISLDILPSALGSPLLTDSIIDAVNAGLAKGSAQAADTQTWKDRLNELALIQIRADATINNAVDATRDLTARTQQLLGAIKPPSPLR